MCIEDEQCPPRAGVYGLGLFQTKLSDTWSYLHAMLVGCGRGLQSQSFVADLRRNASLSFDNHKPQRNIEWSFTTRSTTPSTALINCSCKTNIRWPFLFTAVITMIVLNCVDWVVALSYSASERINRRNNNNLFGSYVFTKNSKLRDSNKPWRYKHPKVPAFPILPF